ncbi:MAG: hypothetical protein JNJ98_08375 [Gemmatimonadetes bacterium]|nr:hypothetical protein [Gemmatimonadota bacterium]
MERVSLSRVLLALILAVSGLACGDATSPDDSTGRERRAAAHADVGTGADTTRSGGGVGLPILTGSRAGSTGVDAGTRATTARPRVHRGTR